MRHPPIFVVAWLASAPALAGDQPLRFGITDTRPSPLACATFQGPQLRSGQNLYILAFDPPRWVRGVVVSKRSSPCRAEALLEGAAYDVQLEQAEAVKQELGVAVIAADGAPVFESGKPLFTSPTGGQAVSFRQCTGSEGVHFLAWQGPTRLWHEYYYLGYDVEPTCSEEELKEQ